MKEIVLNKTYQLIDHIKNKQYEDALDFFLPLAGDICISSLLKKTPGLHLKKEEIGIESILNWKTVITIKNVSLLLLPVIENDSIKFDHFYSVIRKEKYKTLCNCIKGRNCIIYFTYKTDHLNHFKLQVEEVYLKMASLLKIKSPFQNLNYVICTEQTEINSFLGRLYDGDFFDARNLYIFSCREINTHEIAHAVTRNIIGWPPLFMREGFALWLQAAAEGVKITEPNDKGNYNRLLIKGHLLKYHDLNRLDYEASIYFVDKLIRDFSIDQFKKFYTAMTFLGYKESPSEMIKKFFQES